MVAEMSHPPILPLPFTNYHNLGLSRDGALHLTGVPVFRIAIIPAVYRHRLAAFCPTATFLSRRT
jgi:hypothetical protein